MNTTTHDECKSPQQTYPGIFEALDRIDEVILRLFLRTEARDAAALKADAAVALAFVRDTLKGNAPKDRPEDLVARAGKPVVGDRFTKGHLSIVVTGITHGRVECEHIYDDGDMVRRTTFYAELDVWPRMTKNSIELGGAIFIPAPQPKFETLTQTKP